MGSSIRHLSVLLLFWALAGTLFGQQPEVLEETVPDTADQGFGSATVKLTVNAKVKKPRMLFIYAGPEGAVEDERWSAFFEEFKGALLSVSFEKPEGYLDASKGSGDAVIKAFRKLATKAKRETLLYAPVILLGADQGTAFGWSFLNWKPKRVLAAAFVDGEYVGKATRDSFATPLLLVDTKVGPRKPSQKPDLKRGYDLAKHYSTDGCRWTYIHTDKKREYCLLLAGKYVESVASLSPYEKQAKERELWATSPLRERTPKPEANFKLFDEEQALLGSMVSEKDVYPLEAKKGEARRSLVWLPDAAFRDMWLQF